MKPIERIECRTPTPGKQPTRIPRWKFELLREALLRVVPAAPDAIAAAALPAALREVLAPERLAVLGALNWHLVTVKLELEVRGELKRLPGRRPQALQRS